MHNKAKYFAKALGQNGFIIKNDVCFNQALVSLGNSNVTENALKFIQNSKECWCGEAKWDNESVIRISVSSYRTTYEDIDRCVKVFINAKNKALNTNL